MNKVSSFCRNALHWTFVKPISLAIGHRRDAVVVHSYGKLIFAWPLMLFGFAAFLMLRLGWMSEVTTGRIFIVALTTVILTIGIDLNRNATIFWLVAVVAAWFGIIILHDRGFTFFGRVGEFIAGLQPGVKPDFCLMIGLIVLVGLAFLVGNAWLNHRWKFAAGEIEHWSFGRNDDSMGRGAKVISTSYPDFLELLFLLSGTITIYNAQRTMKLAEIRNVPFLPLKVKRINELLQAVAVTGADEEAGGDHEGHECEQEEQSALG